MSLPVQTPGAEKQEDRGRGVTEQNLIWPAHCSIGIAAWREHVRCLLTLTTGADREREREAEGILGHLSDSVFPLLPPQ